MEQWQIVEEKLPEIIALNNKNKKKKKQKKDDFKLGRLLKQQKQKYKEFLKYHIPDLNSEEDLKVQPIIIT